MIWPYQASAASESAQRINLPVLELSTLAFETRRLADSQTRIRRARRGRYSRPENKESRKLHCRAVSDKKWFENGWCHLVMTDEQSAGKESRFYMASTLLLAKLPPTLILNGVSSYQLYPS